MHLRSACSAQRVEVQPALHSEAPKATRLEAWQDLKGWARVSGQQAAQGRIRTQLCAKEITAITPEGVPQE